jgi:Glycosyl transferase family 2
MSEFQHPEVLDWFDRRTFTGPNPGPFTTDANRLAELKREKGLRTSVCLPALNEQTTIGEMCRRMRSELMGGDGLVDELIVIDSGSEDDTVAVARAAGAEVHRIKLNDDLSRPSCNSSPRTTDPLPFASNRGVIERPPMAGVLKKM